MFVSGVGDRTETWSTTLDPSETGGSARDRRDQQGVRLRPSRNHRLDRRRSRGLLAEPQRPCTPADHAPGRCRDLHALLSASGERGPYVLVGHSIGGAISRLYASEYPQDVSGLVLIDYTPYDARKALTDEQWDLWKTFWWVLRRKRLCNYTPTWSGSTNSETSNRPWPPLP